MKNQFYYEDEPLNESGPVQLGHTFWDVAMKGGKSAGSLIGKGIKNIPKAAKFVKSKSSKKNLKIAGGLLGAGAAYDLAATGGQNVAKIGSSALSTTSNVLQTVGAIPNTLLSGVNLATKSAEGISEAIRQIQKNFNALNTTLKCDGIRKASPQCIKLELQKNEYIKKLQGMSTKQKAAIGAGALIAGAAATAIAAKAIKDSFEKKDWYNKKCAGLSDPSKIEKCRAYVKERILKELRSKRKRCDLSNNPEKCISILDAKIKDIESN